MLRFTLPFYSQSISYILMNSKTEFFYRLKDHTQIKDPTDEYVKDINNKINKCNKIIQDNQKPALKQIKAKAHSTHS